VLYLIKEEDSNKTVTCQWSRTSRSTFSTLSVWSSVYNCNHWL